MESILIGFVFVILLIFIAWVIGIIRETHEKVVHMDERIARIELN